METGRINAPFGYEAELVDGQIVLKPSADAVVVKMAYGLFNDLSDVYRKYGLENASSLALKSTTDALNSLPDGSAIYARYKQSREWEGELVESMMETFRQAASK